MMSRLEKEGASEIEITPDEFNSEVVDLNDPVVLEKRGTEFDGWDMHRMGKLPQLRVRIFLGVFN